jgi:hypothetical protein
MKVTTKQVKGGTAVSITCDVCGGHIIGANEYGMYCEKRCREAENKQAVEQMKALMGSFLQSMDDLTQPPMQMPSTERPS